MAGGLDELLQRRTRGFGDVPVPRQVVKVAEVQRRWRTAASVSLIGRSRPPAAPASAAAAGTAGGVSDPRPVRKGGGNERRRTSTNSGGPPSRCRAHSR